jgi:hypothetical protein
VAARLFVDAFAFAPDFVPAPDNSVIQVSTAELQDRLRRMSGMKISKISRWNGATTLQWTESSALIVLVMESCLLWERSRLASRLPLASVSGPGNGVLLLRAGALVIGDADPLSTARRLLDR